MKLFRGITIFLTFFRYGIDELVLSSAPHSTLRTIGRLCTLGRNLSIARGVRLRKALEELGPIFVKFGQLLSTRRDMLPVDIADELALLQDRVPPFDADKAIATIEKAFGKPLDELFVRFERQPVASASIAQVHFAEFIDRHGQHHDVAVKVLRPEMTTVVQRDIDLMRWLASWVERTGGIDARRLKPVEVVDEFSKHLNGELDLMREAANAIQLRRNMEHEKRVRIPEMYWDLCSPSVLVMERMHGIPISQTKRLHSLGMNLHELAIDGVRLFFAQVFRDGFFHADMHPGNILVSVDSQTFGSFILLDFGIVGTLTDFDKDYLAQNFISFFRRDYRRVAELHVESGWAPPDTRIDELESAVRAVCEPYFSRPLCEISLGTVLMRLFQTSRRFQVDIQPQLVLLQKTLLNIEGLGRELYPELDLWSTAQPVLEKWMREQTGLKRFVREWSKQAPSLIHKLPEFPMLVHRYLQHSVTQKHSTELQELIKAQHETNQLLQRLTYGLIGLIVGIALVILLQRALGALWLF